MKYCKPLDNKDFMKMVSKQKQYTTGQGTSIKRLIGLLTKLGVYDEIVSLSFDLREYGQPGYPNTYRLTVLYK